MPGVEHEIAALPPLPLPISVPEFIGVRSDGFPWPFTGHHFIPGIEIADAGLNDAARVPLARGLGEFPRRLHSAEAASRLAACDAAGGLDGPRGHGQAGSQDPPGTRGSEVLEDRVGELAIVGALRVPMATRFDAAIWSSGSRHNEGNRGIRSQKLSEP